MSFFFGRRVVEEFVRVLAILLAEEEWDRSGAVELYINSYEDTVK